MKDLSGLVILIGQDLKAAVTQIRSLESAGFKVIPVINAKEAIETLEVRHTEIELAIIDLSSDETDAANLAMMIQYNYDLPVLFLYDQKSKEKLESVKEINGYGFVPKSDNSALTSSVRSAINLSRKYSNLKQKHRIITETQTALLEVLEKTNEGIFILNRNWRYTFLNYNAGKLMSRDSNELLGKCIWEEFPEAADTEFAKLYKEVMMTGKPASIEEFYKPLNGWYEIFVYPNFDGITVFYREITNRKSVEEELEKQKSFFEQMFLQSATSTQILDKEGWCLRINPKLSELFGVNPEDIEGRVYNIFYDEEIKRNGIDLIHKEVHPYYLEWGTLC